MEIKKINFWYFSSFCISLAVAIPIVTIFAGLFENTSNYYSILKETLDYGSKTMNAAIDQRQDYIYHIVLDKHKFSQIEIDDDGNRIYSENYRRVD